MEVVMDDVDQTLPATKAYQGLMADNLDEFIVAIIWRHKQVLDSYRGSLFPELFLDENVQKIVKSFLFFHDKAAMDNEGWEKEVDASLFLQAGMEVYTNIQNIAVMIVHDPDVLFNFCLARLYERYQTNLLLQCYDDGLSNQDRSFPEHYDNLQAALEDIELVKSKFQKNTFEKDKLLNHVMDVVNDVEKRLSGEYVDVPRISSGYKELDSYLNGGYKHGYMYLCAARPSMGKTLFAVNQLWNCSKGKEFNVLYVSYEVSIPDITNQVLSVVSGLKTETIENRDFSQETSQGFYDAVTAMGLNDNIYLRQPKDKSAEGLEQLVSDFKKERRLDMVIVDHMHKMTTNREVSAYDKFTKIMEQLTNTAVNNNVAFLCMSQLNREIEKRPDKKPYLGDLRDSGKLEENSDVVLMLHRDSYYEPTPANKNDFDIFIRKSRFGARDVQVRLHVNLANKQLQSKFSRHQHSPMLR